MKAVILGESRTTYSTRNPYDDRWDNGVSINDVHKPKSLRLYRSVIKTFITGVLVERCARPKTPSAIGLCSRDK